MIRFEPNALYTRDDLAALLAPAKVDVDHFIARLKPRKVFKMVWLGADILQAFQAAPPLGEDAPAAKPAAIPTGKRGQRRGRKTESNLISLEDIR